MKKHEEIRRGTTKTQNKAGTTKTRRREETRKNKKGNH